ncbi:MAG: acyltransferase [Bacteroidota bacterium]
MKWYIKIKILLSIGRRMRQTRGTAAPVTLKGFLIQYFFGFNKSCYWPVHFSSVVSGAQYIKTGTGTAPGLSHGCYIFAAKGSEVEIGDYTLIAPNVGIAGYNHDLYDYRKNSSFGKTVIGNYSWIGMNAMILPGVKLGDHTVVAAGAVVTKSFPEGYVVIGGNPASVIKKIDPQLCVSFTNENAYVGYLDSGEFTKYKKQLLHTE